MQIQISTVQQIASTYLDLFLQSERALLFKSGYELPLLRNANDGRAYF